MPVSSPGPAESPITDDHLGIPALDSARIPNVLDACHSNNSLETDQLEGPNSDVHKTCLSIVPEFSSASLTVLQEACLASWPSGSQKIAQ